MSLEKAMKRAGVWNQFLDKCTPETNSTQVLEWLRGLPELSGVEHWPKQDALNAMRKKYGKPANRGGGLGPKPGTRTVLHRISPNNKRGSRNT